MKIMEDLKVVKGDMVYKVGRSMYGDHYSLEYVVTNVTEQMIWFKSNTGKFSFTEGQALSKMNLARRSDMTPWMLLTKEELEKRKGESK